MRRIFSWFRRLFKAAAASTVQVNVIQKPEELAEISSKVQQQQEVAFFTRANNIIEEFVAAPTPIFSGNLDNPNPIGYIIDEKTYNLDGTPWNKGIEAEELLADDVSLLKNTAKPDLSKADKSQFIMKFTPDQLIKQAENERQEEQKQKSIEEKASEETIKAAQEQAEERFPEYKEIWKGKEDECE